MQRILNKNSLLQNQSRKYSCKSTARWALASLLAAGCTHAVDANPTNRESLDDQIKGEAELVFHEDWSERTTGLAVAGREVSIRFATSRSECSPQKTGVDLWRVELQMHTPLAPDSILSFPLQTDDGSDGNWATGTMSVDEAGAWKMWIHSTNDQGCEHFDSNLGANYEMQILRRPEWAGNLQVIASETVDQATPFDASRFWVDRRAMVNRVSFEAGDASFLSQDMTPNPQAFRASVHYRYRGEFAWRTIAATYEHQGDKLLFSLPLHAIDPFSGDAENPQCPEVPYIIPEYGSVQTEVELYASVNGKSLRPESSRTIRLIVHRNVGRWLPQDCTSND